MVIELVWWFPNCVDMPVQVAIEKGTNILQSKVGRHMPGLVIRHYGVTENEAIRKHRLHCLERAEYFKDRADRLKNEI